VASSPIPKRWPSTQPIYHYTTPQGLLGILESHTIWASEAAGLNDLDEVRNGWDEIERYLEQNDPGGDFGWVLHESVRAANDPSQSVFVACASSRPDDAGQWDRYASGGLGYALEFDTSVAFGVKARSAEPPDWADKFIAESSYLRTSWDYAIYGREELHQHLDLMWTSISTRLKRAQDDPTTAFHKDLRVDSFEAAKSTLAWLSPYGFEHLAYRYKSSGFESEQEVRCTLRIRGAESAVSHRVSPYGITGYVELSGLPNERQFDNIVWEDTDVYKNLRLPLQKVILGPKIDWRTGKTAVERLLRSTGYDNVEVTRSQVNLR